MPYSLEAGRVIVGPSGLRLVALHRLEVPASEHPDGCTGAYTILATEADRFAHQIVDALNASAPSAERSPDELAGLSTILAALRFYQEHGQGDPANRSDELHELATCGGECISLDDSAIDELCERINTTPWAQVWTDEA